MKIMKQYKFLLLTLMLSLLVMLSACSKKPVMDAEPAPVPAVSEAPAVPAPVVETAVATPARITAAQLEPVYFDYDSHVLSAQAQQILKRNAALLQQESGLVVTIEGHCDERGSDEYNLALGEQRSNAVKSYLVSLGVAAERLNTISYGEERPVVAGNDEAAWSKNRRAQFN
jgi:peptidoglycan-associated lipoprotein